MKDYIKLHAGKSYTFQWTSHKGFIEERKVVFLSVYYGPTPHDEGNVYCLHCLCLDRNDFRSFNMSRIVLGSIRENG